MPFDLKSLVAARMGENYELHSQHLNPTLVQVQRTIGFDRVYVRAKGAYLYDAEGNEYLDFLSGYSVFNVGRNHPVVAQALRDALDLDLPNMVQMDCSLMSGLLGEALLKKTPAHLDAVFFCNSGTEAVEGAMKFARAATGRARIVSLKGSYHGLSYGSLSVTGSESFQEGFGPFLADTELVRLGDLNALQATLAMGDVAAFLVEPVQGKGVNYPLDDYFQKAQALCRKYGTLLICDEVQTGLGRTGKWFAFQHWDLEPDIVTMAKTLSGGYVPCGAIVTRRSIYQRTFSRLDRCVVHSSTFGRNNLAMTCALATLTVLEDEKLVENSAAMGELLMTRLRRLQAKHPFIKEVRGKGLMIAIEFHEPPQLKGKLAWRLMHKIDQSLFPQLLVVPMLSKHRILTQVAGHHMDVIKILPPLTIGVAEVDLFVRALDETLTECTSLSGPIMELAINTAKVQFGGGPVAQRPRAKGKNGRHAANGHGTNGHANGHAVNGNGRANGHGKNGHAVTVERTPAGDFLARGVKSKTVLIVDDEKNTREGLRRSLEDEGDLEIYTAADVAGALAILESEGIDLLLTDLRLGGEDGMTLIDRALKMPAPPVCIMMTAYGSVDTAVAAMKRGAYDFVTKPLDLDRLEILVRRALRSREVESENKELRQQVERRSGKGLEALIGTSAAMQDVFDTIRQVAQTRATVLIEGESGTGKELVAHALHNLSGRKGRFVAVHCAALSPQLLESELFGHEKGAFTGASERRVGRFEQADGGTIFLDEIGEIDASTQVKLLRVLGERTFERVGGNAQIATDARLVAATNKDLEALVAEDKFRADLFYRLNVVRVHMPPLRERPEDIPLMVQAFLKQSSQENAKPLRELTADATNRLLEYPWPGNVRQLRAAVESAVVLAPGPKITLRDLPQALRQWNGSPVAGNARPAVRGSITAAPSLNVHEREADLIRRALADTDGNITRAAGLLGMSRRTLHRKIAAAQAAAMTNDE